MNRLLMQIEIQAAMNLLDNAFTSLKNSLYVVYEPKVLLIPGIKE